MKNAGLLLMVLALCTILNAQKTVNDPNAQVRSVSGFHGVSVSGSIELFLTQGNEESVVISADDTNIRDKVITEVEDGILHIYLERKNKIQIDWPNKNRIRAYVSVKDIDYLSSSGSGKLHVTKPLTPGQRRINCDGFINANTHSQFNVLIKNSIIKLPRTVIAFYPFDHSSFDRILVVSPG